MRFLRNLLITILFVVPMTGSAQLSYFENIDISMSPKDPAPNEEVLVEVGAFSFNTSQAYFTWYVDGSKVDEGFDVRTTITRAKNANIQTVVTVVVSTKDGVILEEQIIIQPTEVTLLWEAQTKTPLFYKGKTLHTPRSEVKLIAIPNLIQNGRRVSSKNLVYTWKVNNKVLGSLSGVGKSSITINNPTSLRDIRAEVFVETQDEIVHGKDTVVISVERPETYLYKEDPLIGRNYNQILQNTFTLTEREVTLIAEPFFFSPDPITYSWEIDDNTLGRNENKITIQSPAEGEGESSVRISLNNNKKLLQSAENKLTLSFGKKLLDSLFNF